MRSHQIDSFVSALRAELDRLPRFVVTTSNAESATMILSGDVQTTKQFIVSIVKDNGSKAMGKLVSVVDSVMSRFGKPPYFSDPIYHISISGWACREEERGSFALLNRMKLSELLEISNRKNKVPYLLMKSDTSFISNSHVVNNSRVAGAGVVGINKVDDDEDEEDEDDDGGDFRKYRIIISDDPNPTPNPNPNPNSNPNPNPGFSSRTRTYSANQPVQSDALISIPDSGKIFKISVFEIICRIGNKLYNITLV